MKASFTKISSRGFTLVETLIAISILSLALLPPVYTAYQSVVSANFAKDQMIASYLAQDAMDYIIAKKNQNIIACTNNQNDDDNDNGNGNPPDDEDCDQPNTSNRKHEFGQYWLADLHECSGVNKCNVDTTRRRNDPYTFPYIEANCATGTECNLWFDKVRNMYRPSQVVNTGNGNQFVAAENKNVTKFKRYAMIEVVSDGTTNYEAKVKVVVTWKSSGFSSDDAMTIRANMYNVFPKP
ncbi:MAG: type II secretion system GspH family protein [bacterium]|nr:type II secretion system GspH family protein [bacterium]